MISSEEKQQKQEENNYDNMEETSGLWALDYNCQLDSVYIYKQKSDMITSKAQKYESQKQVRIKTYSGQH